MSLIEKTAPDIKEEDTPLLKLLDLSKTDEEIIEVLIDARALDFGKAHSHDDQEV